ncbi:MAG: ferrous iron transport protein A [Actinobacteria bacterium]|nr:MAG: ferrous iron transport protein A [Actinomycetota bacterium]
MRNGQRKKQQGGTQTLDTMRRGEHCRILGIDDDRARGQAIRFGMGEGALLSCITKVPAGPLVMRSGRQEIAIGRQLAQRIRIEHLDPQGSC